ncbi:hypothetical protein ACFQY4_30160 [Catellatospora bangladeshensis]|uniref:Uncharacterized protein n=1 Tax=Catellatospora bangladeshensis TaxID=310355 RepID=A0A8J3NH09_9ACTN|nr:hypothetical protein [Catellatospora bangladeshensis]GIF80787.1 hypothetical protein Cba03nite_21360 [Catellatospora bangladeshensis]
MNAAQTPPWEQRSTARVLSPARPRKLAKVPFVELADGRLQGVVSSGSDIERVYVSSLTAKDYSFHCSTNNNRPCGGIRSGGCNHLRALADEAVLQYGIARVARYLRADVADSATTGGEVLSAVNAWHQPSAGAPVFSRFLRHLAYLELPASTEPLAELQWFPAGGAVR